VFYIDTALFILFTGAVISDLRKYKTTWSLNVISLSVVTIINSIHLYLFGKRTMNLMNTGQMHEGYLSWQKIYVNSAALLEIVIAVVVVYQIVKYNKKKNRDIANTPADVR
jgi:hypothetical protein